MIIFAIGSPINYTYNRSINYSLKNTRSYGKNKSKNHERRGTTLGNNSRRHLLRRLPHGNSGAPSGSSHLMPRKLKIHTAIDAKKFYTLYEIARDDLFETGLKNQETRKSRCRMIITTDKYTNNYLKSAIVPDEIRGRKYAIRGEDIIKYLANKDANASN